MKRLLPIVFLLCATQVLAQSWPSRPVRVVVPLGAGGFADVPARILAPRLAAQTGGTGDHAAREYDIAASGKRCAGTIEQTVLADAAWPRHQNETTGRCQHQWVLSAAATIGR